MDCGFETVIERQLNYFKVVLHMCVCACRLHVGDVCMYSVRVCVCAHGCNKMGLDIKSHHTKRDNQIMIKTKQMVT